MTVARYVVHKMIQDILLDEERASLFASDPEPAFAAYGLKDAEREAIGNGSIVALNAIGVHPNLQMKLARLKHANAAVRAALPMVSYLERIKAV